MYRKYRYYLDILSSRYRTAYSAYAHYSYLLATMKSGKEQAKHRAAGPEKSQDRPTHTELQTLNENEQVTNMEEQQQSSSSSAHDIDRINFDSENKHLELPVVDALTTPTLGSNLRGNLAHIATVKQLQETEQRIKHQATYIQDLEFQLCLQEAYKENLLRDRTISRLPSAPLSVLSASAHETEIMQDEQAIQQLIESLALKKQAYTKRQHTQSPELMVPESPGPHRRQPRPARPQGVAYRQQQLDQEEAEKESSTHQPMSTQDEMVNVFKSLTKVLSDNNKQLHYNDVTDPPKFNGQDSHWDDWYLNGARTLKPKDGSQRSNTPLTLVQLVLTTR
jgi:hypothetical protein